MAQELGEITLKRGAEGATTLSSDPFVAVFDDVVSEEERSYIIEKAREMISPARVVFDDKIDISKGRSGGNCWLRYADDEKIAEIGNRISEKVGLPLENAESMQVIHYGTGQEYRHHFDAFNLATEKGLRAGKRGGQRLVTALVYLNDVDAGGGTDFKRLEVTVDPKPGRMVVFHNTEEDISKPHPKSLHAGLPVEEGEKWAFNIWFRHQPVRQELKAEDVDVLPSVKFV